MSISSIAAQAPAVQSSVAQRTTDFVPQRSTSASSAPNVSSPAAQQQQLEDAMRAVAEFAKPMAGNLEFSLDDQTGKTIVKVVDATTKELIRQIPSEEMLDIARALDRLQGILVRQKA